MSTQTQTVTVDDMTPPTITCAASDSRNTDPNQFSYTVVGAEFDPSAANDNCGVQSVTHNYDGGGTSLDGFVFPPGLTTVTWTVLDVNGLSQTCAVTITVVPQQVLNGSINIAATCSSKIVTVKVYEPGTSNLLYDLTAPLDGSGNFSVSGIIPGDYDIFVKTGGFLQKGLLNQTIAAGTTALAFGALSAGDINGDNVVDGVDLSALIAAYNSLSGNPAYNPNADFDCNGNVDGVDLSALISNYNQLGDAPTP